LDNLSFDERQVATSVGLVALVMGLLWLGFHLKQLARPAVKQAI
jgi:high-affinity Fe2+/Pb2+ permease